MIHSKGEQPSTRPVCRVDVHLDALAHNLALLRRSLAHAEPICMVKANAYGHGALLVARHLQNIDVKWLGVATVDEGIALREAGVKTRILIMSGAGIQFFVPDLVNHELTPLVSNDEELQALSLQAPHGFRVHLDLDTGMVRGGFLSLDAANLFAAARSLKVEGISTHFAKAETQECAFSKAQAERFIAGFEKLVEAGFRPQYVHLDKSASILTHASEKVRHEIQKRWPNVSLLMRPGLSLYGIDPTAGASHVDALRPALSWRAPIVLRKTLPAGTPVGYDGTFVTTRHTEFALVRVGYADGLKRSLSNRGHMIIHQTKVPILGRISMDLTAIDVTELVERGQESECEAGRYAFIIGGDGENRQSVYDLARACDTIPYEILTSISSRVQRFSV